MSSLSNGTLLGVIGDGATQITLFSQKNKAAYAYTLGGSGINVYNILKLSAGYSSISLTGTQIHSV